MRFRRTIPTLFLTVAAAGSASAQTSEPSQTYSYLFSSCAFGVSMQVTFPVKTVLGPAVSPGSRSFTYISEMSTFTLITGSVAQTFNGLAATSVLYSGVTSFMPQDLTTVKFDPSANQGGPPWSVNLQGNGDLLPNGLTQPLPPLSFWALQPPLGTLHDYIQVNNKFYFIDTFGPCAPGGATDLSKLLGDAIVGCVLCGNPVNVGTGNKYEQAVDYRTAGSNPLAFTRYYNSLAGSNTFANGLGTNWRSTYDRYLRIASATSVTAERANGQQVSFRSSGGNWTPDTDVDLKLTNSATTWTLTDSSDTVETYTATSANEALLRTITARNGYTQTLQYNAAGQLMAVTDSYQRQLTFTYSNGKLQTVTTPDGLVVTYGYTGSLLTSVGYSTTPPASQTYLYENAAFPAALTGLIDENGNRYATWTYDSAGRAISSQHAGGDSLTRIAYNDTDGSRTVTTALGAQLVYKFTTLQGVPKVTEIDRQAFAATPAAVIKFTYDSNGYTASKTDWNGALTNYVNDVHGQPIRIVEAAGTPLARTTTIIYHQAFHLPVSIVQPGLITFLTYDSSGELLTKTLTDTTTTTAPYPTSRQSRTWTYTWSNYLLTSVRKPRTDVAALTRFTYDASGALTGTTNAAGQTAQVTRHLPGGLPQTIVDSNGVAIEFTYDARLRLLAGTIDTAAGPLTTSFRYDAAGNLLGVTQPDGSAFTNTYDAAHRLTGVTDLFNQSVAYTLDALGDRAQVNVLDSGGNRQFARSDSFDVLARLLRITRGAGQTTSYSYDPNGNALSVTDALARATSQAFDALNRPTRGADAAKGVTAVSYDPLNQPVGITDPNGASTTYVYDGFGGMIQRVSADSGATVYHYDLDGNLSQSVDANGAVANYTYDILDRLIAVSYPGDAAENVTYTYDEAAAGFGVGRLTSVTDAAGTLHRTYDERGNVLSETRVTGAATLVTAYTYDAASRIASITYPSGWTAVYSNDAMGRTTAVDLQAPDGGETLSVLSGIGYQPFGPVNTMTFGNGVVEIRGYDLDYRLTNLADAGIQNLTYTYDAADNVSSIVDAVTPGSSQRFTYDALDHVSSAAGAYGSASYTYDGAGNRLTQAQSGSANSYSYAPQSNQLTLVTAGGAPQSIGYTKTGNVSSLAGTAFTYNQAGRLATVTAAGNAVAQYTYDAFGRRLGKVGAITAATLYQYDLRGHLLEQTDDQGSPLADYIYLGSLPVATLSPNDGQIYYLHCDRLGAPQAATDSGRNPVWTAAYGPFGEMSAIPAGILQDLRLPGQEFDVDTGLYHNGARDYAPAWGRYLQPDPLGLAGGMNPYAYALGNPIKLIDPLGTVPAGGAQGQASGAGSAAQTQAQCPLAAAASAVDAAESVRDFNKFFGGALATLQTFNVLRPTPIYGGVNLVANAVSFVDQPSVNGFFSVVNSLGVLGVPLVAVNPAARVAEVTGSFGYNLGKDIVQTGYSIAADLTGCVENRLGVRACGSDALDLSLVRAADRIDQKVDVAKFFLYQITHVSVDMDTGALLFPPGPR